MCCTSSPLRTEPAPAPPSWMPSSAESAALWVADPNPRAQAFYRKHGFVADGTVNVENGVRELRMVCLTAAGAPRPDFSAQTPKHGEGTA